MQNQQILIKPSSGINTAVVRRISHFIFLLSLVLLATVLFSKHVHAKPLFSQHLAASQSTVLRIAVSANFAPVLEQLKPNFQQQHNIKLQLIKGATGTLFQQIKHGAPFDVFMAADAIRPKTLEQQKLIQPDSRTTYALGKLAYWSAKKTLNSLATLNDFNDNNDKITRIAIANPNIAPYGKAAKETLQSLKLWQKYKDHLIIGINIGQTFQQVRSKAVNSGLVAHSQLILSGLSGVPIPSHYHQPIQQQLVITKSSKNVEAAKVFVNYILSNNIQAKIMQFGYQSANKSTG